MPSSDKFKFLLLTGNDPDSQYDAVVTKDPYTFYLLSNGKGYLGNTPLFGGDMASPVRFLSSSGTYSTFEAGKIYAITTDGVILGENVSASPKGIYYASSTSALIDLTLASFTTAITNYIANNAVQSTGIDNTFVGADSTIMTSKATVDYVQSVLSNTSILQSAFFRSVELHELSAADISGGLISVLPTDEPGDMGLLFTRDDDMTDDPSGDSNQQQFFVNLKGFITVVTVTDTNSITGSVSNNAISLDLNVNANENSIIVDSNGVSLNKTNVINNGDGSTDPDTGTVNTAASADKLVTEYDLVNYINDVVLVAINDAIADALEDVVTYTENNGTGPNITLTGLTNGTIALSGSTPGSVGVSVTNYGSNEVTVTSSDTEETYVTVSSSISSGSGTITLTGVSNTTNAVTITVACGSASQVFSVTVSGIE